MYEILIGSLFFIGVLVLCILALSNQGLSSKDIDKLKQMLDDNNINYTSSEDSFITYIKGHSYSVTTEGVRVLGLDKKISIDEFKNLIQ